MYKIGKIIYRLFSSYIVRLSVLVNKIIETNVYYSLFMKI